MTKAIDKNTLNNLQQLNAEKRFHYVLKTFLSDKEIWILTDEHGAVMINAEDEDCVPVWPHKECAELWATGDWDKCEPLAISLDKWHAKWTDGLTDDEVAVAVFPNQDEEGVVVSAEEFAFELVQLRKKGPGSAA